MLNFRAPLIYNVLNGNFPPLVLVMSMSGGTMAAMSFFFQKTYIRFLLILECNFPPLVLVMSRASLFDIQCHFSPLVMSMSMSGGTIDFECHISPLVLVMSMSGATLIFNVISHRWSLSCQCLNVWGHHWFLMSFLTTGPGHVNVWGNIDF